ncbi:peptidase domain-containing ABC transporter [Massilia sp. R2A-15]|uniref:peptidase domain-containing ABC transporter n=1 Tax=Massilia sp. R2A-15 TaxID=3064278 RepID=UPI0027343250|nr:peptidase domain-containing ABC transporter [Massilia sp. R2A-15]WLI90245.1 peptidase domain-containing ABC transporter [Massilia sp. R2A-15]
MNLVKDLKLGWSQRVPVLMQTEAAECSLACIAMVASYHGHETDVAEMRKRYPVSLKGATVAHIAEVTDQMGMACRPLQLELAELSQLQLPAILHWNLNHFVVLHTLTGGWAYIHDPAIGALKLRLKTVSDHFTGIAIELEPGMAFRRKAPPPAIELKALIGKVVGLKRGLAQLLGLALVIEVLALALPILTQWITDEAIVGGDRDLLTVLGFGMVAIGLSTAVIGAVRSYIGMYISARFNMQWMSNVMGRMMKLPVEYFERRHVGDIVSRFGAVKSIEHGLTNAAIEAALDGLLAIGTLVMMVLYAPALAGVTVGAVSLYGTLRWLRYSAERTAATGMIAKQAKEQTFFLETVRGVRTIKMCNRERERRTAWLNLWVDATNAGLVMQKLSLLFGTSWSFISSVERAFVFWLGAVAVIDHRMSLGMLFAFLSYKEQFAGRINRLIDSVVEFKMLGISAERLADIVLTAPEERNIAHRREPSDDLTLALEDVSFRYAADDALLLNGATLKVKPGECVAIIGPSGCGKTTYLKLILGILKPEKGKIHLGGLSVAQLGLQNYRNVVATVMQDDHLFAGSVYDNIAFLDPKPDTEWLHACARSACIHDEIVQMPMGYQTLVGDMGSVLSGGQKQRVLLARALYRRPKILLLDEATSQLDVGNEAMIGEAIAALDITRIMIAHRPQTIAIADRIVRLEQGKFVDVTAGTGIAPRQMAESEKSVRPV